MSLSNILTVSLEWIGSIVKNQPVALHQWWAYLQASEKVLFVTNTKVTFRLTSEYFHLKGHSSKNILQLPRVGVEGRSESGKLVNSRKTVKITQTKTIDSLVNDETKQDLMQVTYKAIQIVRCAPVLAVLAVMHISCLLPDWQIAVGFAIAIVLCLCF